MANRDDLPQAITRPEADPGADVAALHWRDATWTTLRDLDRARLVAILPTGAVEAHGPHLPLSTDRVIALAMAENGAGRLRRSGVAALVLPALEYTAAPFAAAFPGTLSVRPATVTALLVDIGRALAAQGVGCLALANAHFDPAHLGALYAAVAELAVDPGTEALAVVFPDVTRKPWAPRLGEEFRSGACHAGRYEGSVVLARRPDLVQQDLQRALEPNPRSLSTAIRQGKTTFAEAGGEHAYFGDPAAATAAEGRATIETLGQILAEAVLAVSPHAGHPSAGHPSAGHPSAGPSDAQR